MWGPSQSNRTAFWGRKTLLKLDLSTGCVGVHLFMKLTSSLPLLSSRDVDDEHTASS